MEIKLRQIFQQKEKSTLIDKLKLRRTIMENKIIVRKYEEKDLPAMIRIWNEVVEDGVAFPQEELLTEILAVLKEQQAAAPTVGPTIIFEGKITFGGVEIYRV